VGSGEEKGDHRDRMEFSQDAKGRKGEYILPREENPGVGKPGREN